MCSLFMVSSKRSQVKHLFLKYCHREPTEAEYYVHIRSCKDLGFEAKEQEFKTCDEHFICSLFQTYLKRLPSMLEVEWHLKTLTKKKTRATLTYDFQTCDEAFLIGVLDETGIELSQKEFTSLLKRMCDHGKLKLIQELQAEHPKCQLLPRVALMVCGHFRNFKGLHSAWDEFKKCNPHVDVFVHTWTDPGIRTASSWIKFEGTPLAPLDVIRNTLHPVAIKIEALESLLPSMSLHDGNGSGEGLKLYYTYNKKFEKMNNNTDFTCYIMSQLYSISEAFALVEQHASEIGKKYDVVVRMRADCKPVLPDACRFINYAKRLNDNELFVNGSNTHKHYGGGGGCKACNQEYANGSSVRHHVHHTNDICDIFYYGTQNAMAVACHMYYDARALVKQFHFDNEMAIQDPAVVSYIAYAPRVNLYTIQHGKIYENYVKCFYPERLLREYLRDFWILSDPSGVNPFQR